MVNKMFIILNKSNNIIFLVISKNLSKCWSNPDCSISCLCRGAPCQFDVSMPKAANARISKWIKRKRANRSSAQNQRTKAQLRVVRRQQSSQINSIHFSISLAVKQLLLWAWRPRPRMCPAQSFTPMCAKITHRERSTAIMKIARSCSVHKTTLNSPWSLVEEGIQKYSEASICCRIKTSSSRYWSLSRK